MMKRCTNVPSCGALQWTKDLALTCTGVPVLAAAFYGISLAYKTYHPPRIPQRQRPEDLDLQAIMVKISVPRSSVSLDAWFIPAENSPHTVIIGHGLGRNKSSALQYAAFIHEAGYNVLAFDHRNHGSSSTDGSLRPMSRRFTDDMEAAILFVQNKPEIARGNIALFAFSFSTFPALYVMQRQETRVRAIICDSGPAMNVQRTCHRFVEAGKLRWPRIFRGPILGQIMKSVYANVAHAMLAVKWPPDLAHVPINMLFIANEKDVIIPADEVKQVAGLYPNAEYWLASGAAHLMAARVHREAYRKLVVDFLARNLRN